MPQEAQNCTIDRLTAQQDKLLDLLADPEDTRPQQEKVAEIGVAYSTAYRWARRIPGWYDELARRTRLHLAASLPSAVRAVRLVAEHGSENAKVQAANSIFKGCGWHQDASSQQETNIALQIVGTDGQASYSHLRAAQRRPESLSSASSAFQDIGVWHEMGQDHSGRNGGSAPFDRDAICEWLGLDR